MPSWYVIICMKTGDLLHTYRSSHRLERAGNAFAFGTMWGAGSTKTEALRHAEAARERCMPWGEGVREAAA